MPSCKWPINQNLMLIRCSNHCPPRAPYKLGDLINSVVFCTRSSWKDLWKEIYSIVPSPVVKQALLTLIMQRCIQCSSIFCKWCFEHLGIQVLICTVLERLFWQVLIQGQCGSTLGTSCNGKVKILNRPLLLLPQAVLSVLWVLFVLWKVICLFSPICRSLGYEQSTWFIKIKPFNHFKKCSM